MSSYDWQQREKQKMKASSDLYEYLLKHPEKIKAFDFFSGVRNHSRVIKRSCAVAERQDSSR